MAVAGEPSGLWLGRRHWKRQSGLHRPGDQRTLEDVHVQCRCRLVRVAAPPQIRPAADSDGVKNSTLNSAEARGPGAVPGVAFQREFEPHTLAVGAQPKYRRRDAPWAFAFRVGARSLAGAVVAAQAAREVARLAGVGRGLALRLEDVAAESGTERTGRSGGHDRASKVGRKEDNQKYCNSGGGTACRPLQ